MNDIALEKPIIEMKSVTKVYGKGRASVHALKGIDLKIYHHEFIAIMGTSGSGKSTCMNILGCLDIPTDGDYRFQGMGVGELTRDQRALVRRHYLGFIFQGFNLLARTSALENVELPMIYRGIPTKDRRKMAREALAAVNLSGWESHTPSELSGGQQQRVAIARAIVNRPKVILADEPTGNLDSATSRDVMNLLREFNQEYGITIVMVTHEADMAQYAQRRIQFSDGVIDQEHDKGKN